MLLRWGTLPLNNFNDEGPGTYKVFFGVVKDGLVLVKLEEVLVVNVTG